MPLLLLLLLLDRARGARWVPAAVFVLLALASVGDPLAEVIGRCRWRRSAWRGSRCAGPAASAPCERTGTSCRWRPRRRWPCCAARVVGHLIPALGGFKINQGVTGLIPLGRVPGNGPLVLRSLLALFGADFQDAPAGGGNHPVNLAFAAVHVAGLALVVAAVAAAVWGLARTLAWLARDRSGGPADAFRPATRSPT